MENTHETFEKVPGLYKVIPLKLLRNTPGVSFNVISKSILPRIDSIDRVMHEKGAVSPGPVNNVLRPWYMHTHQDDHLLVLHGKRLIEIYSIEHGKIESFEAAPEYIKKNGKMLYEGSALLMWPRGVFHRIISCDISGSASMNFAIHYNGFDIRTNFNIYDLDTKTGLYNEIRKGHLDQPGTS